MPGISWGHLVSDLNWSRQPRLFPVLRQQSFPLLQRGVVELALFLNHPLQPLPGRLLAWQQPVCDPAAFDGIGHRSVAEQYAYGT